MPEEKNTQEVPAVPMVTLTKNEIRKIIDLIINSQIPGGEVIFVANIIGKLVALSQEIEE